MQNYCIICLCLINVTYRHRILQYLYQKVSIDNIYFHNGRLENYLHRYQGSEFFQPFFSFKDKKATQIVGKRRYPFSTTLLTGQCHYALRIRVPELIDLPQYKSKKTSILEKWFFNRKLLKQIRQESPKMFSYVITKYGCFQILKNPLVLAIEIETCRSSCVSVRSEYATTSLRSIVWSVLRILLFSKAFEIIRTLYSMGYSFSKPDAVEPFGYLFLCLELNVL